MANPLLNERDIRGTKLATSNADLTTVARLTPDQKNAVYFLDIKVIGVRLTGSGGSLPAVFAYWRKAVFATSSTGVVTQVGSTDTIGSDAETDSSASIVVVNDGTNVDIKVSASYAANWTAHVDTLVQGQALV